MLHAAASALDSALRESATGPEASVTPATANRVYVDARYTNRVRPTFRATLEQRYIELT